METTRGFYHNRELWNHVGNIGNLGVRVFFVISGYIITVLLLKEFEKTGTISIKNFYARRTLRIFPASYFFLLVVTVASWFGIIALHRGDLLHAYTYTMNYFQGRSWWVGHLWSLSVEEQFYLLWPAAVLFLGIRKGLKSAVAVVLLAPFVRLAIPIFWRSQIPNIGESFPTIADTIATGCLLAGYKNDLLARPWFRKLIDSSYFFLIPLMAFALNIKTNGRLRSAILETIINACIALCICRVTVHTKDWAGRVLNWAPLMFIGVLSYSLYLWQQLFLNGASSAWVNAFPQNLILAFCAAVTSHYAIERPFLSLRDRFRKGGAKRKSSVASGSTFPIQTAGQVSDV